MVAAERNPLRRFGLRLLAPSILKPYAFAEAFLLPAARRVRAAVQMPLMLLGGVTKLATLRAAMAEGFEFVAMARALLFDPDLVRHYRDAAAAESGCTHCNRCMTTMERGGTRCVLRDAAA
jgi:2,4-dienoyl-CoA reductase-like NADH-dependent reductase (Old Yellow Enzyme family)